MDTYAVDSAGHGEGSTGEPLPWWSFTKTVIAIAAFRAAEQGLLGLDEHLVPHGRTLRQLLRHEGGLPDYGSWPDYHVAVAAGGEPWPASVVVQRGLGAIRRTNEWYYSNIGYAVVRGALEERTAQSFGESLSSLVLIPAGAGSTRLAETRADVAGLRGLVPGYHPGWVYHGLLVGPLSEAVSVVRALLAGKLLRTDSLQDLLHRTPLPQFSSVHWRDAAYGAGVMSPLLKGGHRLVGHTGGGPGSSIAVYAADTPSGPAAAAAFSAAGGDVEASVTGLLEGLLGE